MRTLKELKKDLEKLQSKGYYLESYRLDDLTIKNILENNIHKHRNKIFMDNKKYDLETISENDFKIYDENKKLKDFNIIEKEIKNFFNNMSKEDILKDLTRQPKLYIKEEEDNRMNFFDLSLEDKKQAIFKEHKKDLTFKCYYNDYSKGRDYLNFFNTFKNIINIVLDKDFLSFKDLDINYNDNLINIEDKINKSQDVLKIRVFKNGKIKIKFLNNNEDFNKARKHFLNNELKRHKKNFLVLYDVLKEEDYKNINYLKVYENEENAFIELRLNYFDLQNYKNKYPRTYFIENNNQNTRLYNIKCVDSILKNDLKSNSKDIFKKRFLNCLDDSRLNNYAKDRFKSFFNKWSVL